MLEGSCYKALNNKHFFSNGGITRAKDELTHLVSELEIGSCTRSTWRWQGRLILSLPITGAGLQTSFRTLEDQMVWNNGGFPNLHKAQSK